MIVFIVFTYIFIKELLLLNVYLNHQLGYLFSLYLNNQLINFIVLIIFITLFKKKIFFYKSFIIFIYLYCFSLFTIKFNINILWPNTLLVGLNNIHPYFYYYSFLVLSIIFFKKYFFPLQLSISSVSYTFTIALYLGMSWGSINDLWGFFWVDDLIEIILLFFLTISLILLHIYNKWFDKTSILLYFSLLILLYCVRLGIVSTRHSFFLDLQIASYANYINLFLPYIFTSIYSIIYLNYIKFLFFSLFCYLYILTYLYQIYVYKKFINNIFLLILHLTIFFLFLIWLFTVVNFTLYYNYINIGGIIKNYLFTINASYYNNLAVLYNKLISVFLNLPILYSQNYYLYKILTTTYFAIINYSYIFYNIFFFIFFKKYYFSRV